MIAAVQTRSQVNPNEICLDFSRGRCVRGSLCKYSHDLNLLSQLQSSAVHQALSSALRGSPMAGDHSGSGEGQAATVGKGKCLERPLGSTWLALSLLHECLLYFVPLTSRAPSSACLQPTSAIAALLRNMSQTDLSNTDELVRAIMDLLTGHMASGRSPGSREAAVRFSRPLPPCPCGLLAPASLPLWLTSPCLSAGNFDE